MAETSPSHSLGHLLRQRKQSHMPLATLTPSLTTPCQTVSYDPDQYDNSWWSANQKACSTIQKKRASSLNTAECAARRMGVHLAASTRPLTLLLALGITLYSLGSRIARQRRRRECEVRSPSSPPLGRRAGGRAAARRVWRTVWLRRRIPPGIAVTKESAGSPKVRPRRRRPFFRRVRRHGRHVEVQIGEVEEESEYCSNKDVRGRAKHAR